MPPESGWGSGVKRWLGGAASAAMGVAGLGLGPAAAQVADPATVRRDEPAPTQQPAEPSIPAPADGVQASPAATGPSAAPAQTPSAPDAPTASGASDGRLVYEAGFFSTFSPINALQIVARVPGFTLEQGDQEVRGFGGAAGNVVINGRRPSAKSDTLEGVLQRIPANRVLRVEVGRGDLFGAEFAGKPQVANLVLTDAGGLAGNVEGTVYRDYTGKLFPEGTASALLRRGPSSLNVAVGVKNDYTSDQGFDRLTAAANGSPVEFRRKFNRSENPNGYLSAAYEITRGENRVAHLNARVARDRFGLTQFSDVFPAAGPIRDDLLTQRNRLHSQELGGDYSTPFAGGVVKLIGLATRKQRLNRDAQFFRVESEVVDGLTQRRDDDRAETLVRVVWNKTATDGWSIETGVEGVLNKLVSRVDLFSLGAGTTPVRIDLPVDDATVEETRGEVFVNAGRGIAKNLRLDVGVTFEASELSVTGDAEARRVLRFLKPRATLDWRFGKDWHAQASLKRTVAQLQFEDFISAAELGNERVNGGNAQLLPQRAWEALAFLEKPVLGDGLVRLELGHNRISLVQDRVPTPEGFDAPGNLGDGELYLARARVDTPVDKLGIPGGRVSVLASYIKTSVQDPYTGRDRIFSGNTTFFATVSFRQDFRKFAYGFELEGGTSTIFYRIDEIDDGRSGIPYITAFAEYRPSPKTTITAGVNNATAAPSIRRRSFYDPDRRTPEPSVLEFRKRNSYVVPYITLKHSFG